MKSLKLTEYFRIIKPEYVYMKLIPDTSIRNYNSENIVKSIHHMQKNITKRIRFEEKGWVVDPLVKCSYFMDIKRKGIDFYFIVPKQYTKIAYGKIIEIWPKITVEEVAAPPHFSLDAVKYQLVYKREPALSLAVDKKSNEPLNHVLSVADILEEGERVGVFCNFIPYNQKGWTKEHALTMQRIKNKESVDRYKLTAASLPKAAISNTLALAFGIADGLVETVTEFFGGEVKKEDKSIPILDLAIQTINLDKDVSATSKRKRNETVIDTQLVICAEGDNKIQNALAVCQSYKILEEENILGNELVHHKLPNNTKIDYEAYRLSGIDTNRMSFGECSNFIQLPGRDLLMQFKNIAKVDVTETEVPVELQNGKLRAGVSIHKGKATEVFHTEHKELKNTAVCLCGPNRGGKSTAIANEVYDLVMDGRVVVLPDFCGACQLSDELAEVIPKENIINIYCNNWDTLQGFGYNEIVPRDDSPFELYNCAKMKAARLKEFINLINDGDNDLEGRMERIMLDAAIITFVNNGSVNDVFKMIKDHEMRHRLIASIPAELKEELEEYVEELKEIDEIQTKGDNKGEVIGTKYSHTSAILSRVHRLKENAYIEMMLKKSTDDNINLLDLMEEKGGRLICLRMYDSMFVSQQQKDIYVCYWMTKIWGALQMRFCKAKNQEEREALIQVGILIDELYQTKNCEKYLTMILSQMPKYRTKLVVSCHHLGQIPTIFEEMKSAMCSFSFIRGSNKKNFTALKEEFEDLGFTLDDLLHLKQYQALNLFSYEGGYWAGITLLPPPVSEYLKQKSALEAKKAREVAEIAAEATTEVVTEKKEKPSLLDRILRRK